MNKEVDLEQWFLNDMPQNFGNNTIADKTSIYKRLR
jgi:hypothetical protein